MTDKTINLLSLRGKGTGPLPAAASGHAGAAAEMNSDEEECRCYGYLRGIRDRALSLEFRFADGRSQAFPYTSLGWMKYEPSAGVLIQFTGDPHYLVLLEGLNLNALVNGSISLFDQGILRHRVTWVREVPRQEAASVRAGEVTVRCIRMQSCRHSEEPQRVEWLEAFLKDQ